MPDHKEVLDRLDRYAKACARNNLRKFDLGHDWHRSEDMAQVLFLAGWQVWKARGDEGLAKHRISSRAKNEAERPRAGPGFQIRGNSLYCAARNPDRVARARPRALE
jgi:hypothetical protein